MSDIERSVEIFASTVHSDGIVLDIGCGTRPYEKCFSPVTKYLGLDVYDSGRSSDIKKADIWYDGVSIPLEDNSVDGVLCTQVLEHVVEPYQLLSEIKRVMKPGAHGLISVPFLWGEHEIPYDFRRFTSFGLKKILKEFSFEIDDFKKSCIGIDAIKTLMLSEINYHKTTNPNALTANNALRSRIIDKVAHKMILVVLKYLSKYYKFERVYIDNIISFRSTA